jgi:hypothetical protein
VIAAALVAFIVGTQGRAWNGKHVVIVLSAVVVGSAAAAVSARVDGAVFRPSPERALRWGPGVRAVGVVGGVMIAFVLARSGSVGVVVVVASFLLGFLVPRVQSTNRALPGRDIANPA